MSESASHKLESLESLRGLAAIAVLFSHLVSAFWPAMKDVPGFPPTALWHDGEFAVRLFFVLSGFVLSLSFCRRKDIQTLSAGASKRYFRLYIPASASVAFAYVLHVCGAFESLRAFGQLTDPSNWLTHFYGIQPSLKQAVREAFLSPLLEYSFPVYNEVLWTMGVELKGSLLVFATLALFGTARHRWLVYGILILSLDSLQLRYGVDFACGMALCDWHCHRPLRQRDSILWVLAFAAGCCLADMNVDWAKTVGAGTLTRGYRFWPTVAAVLLVASAARSQHIQWMLSARPLVWLGQSSFALYLFHIPIVCSLGAWTFVWLASSGASHDLAAAAAATACIIVSLAVAQAGPWLLDPFAIRVGRQFERLLFPVSDHDVLSAEMCQPIQSLGCEASLIVPLQLERNESRIC